MSRRKLQVITCVDVRIAKVVFDRFIVEHRKDVAGFDWRKRYVLLRDGWRYEFITLDEYDKWCIGKTYKKDGRWYHNGVRMTEKE